MVRLADITKRADRLIGLYAGAILPVVNGLTAESPDVAALFDGSDEEGLEIYRELGFEADVRRDGVRVVDIREALLAQTLRRHQYVPIDEPQAYFPGTVMLYVFTMSAVVGRRFEKGADRIAALREVRRFRDVEIQTSLRVEGAVAIEMIVQRAAPILKQLWTGNEPRVALIQSAGHGLKAGYVKTDFAVKTLRNAATQAAPPDRGAYLGMAESLAAESGTGKVACLIQGFGKNQLELIWVEEKSMVAQTQRDWDGESDRVFQEWIVACRVPKRALGLLEKCLDKLGESSPASGPLAELVALVRHSWADCTAIEGQIPVVLASVDRPTSPAGVRVRTTLLALMQATAERKRGDTVGPRGKEPAKAT